VLVLSDHGMHEDPYNVDKPAALNSGAHEDAPDGVVGMLGPLAEALGDRLGAARPLGHVGEVAPLVLQLQGVPVPRDWPAAGTQRRALENLLDEEWRVAHPLTVGPGMADFRGATPSRVPAAGMNQKFVKNMQDLGYLGGTEAQEGADPESMDSNGGAASQAEPGSGADSEGSTVEDGADAERHDEDCDDENCPGCVDEESPEQADPASQDTNDA